FDLTQAKLHVADFVLLGDLAGKREHLRSHVHTDGATAASHLGGSQKTVEAGAAAQIDDDVVLLNIYNVERIAAAKAEVCFGWHQGDFLLGIAHAFADGSAAFGGGKDGIL